jgi:4-amino-4-deoxy-L-arabinose transferase-like glycosyltransferase
LSAFGRYFSIRSLKYTIRNYALLFLGCVLFHVVGTWNLPLIDRDEPRFAEAAREMRERGDYIVPYFDNHFRFDKPPLTYWAQVASYRIFGENDFAARFPSVIAAALTALSISAWGSRVGGQKPGWWTAIIFTLSLQTFVHAKAAVADMWLVLFVTIAHWAGYELLRDRLAENQRPTFNPPSQGYGAADVQRLRPGSPTGWKRSTSNTQGVWWTIFYFSLALAFLAKGPIGWTPLLTVVLTIFFLPEPTLAGRFKFARGLLFTLAIVSLWGIPALVRTNGEFFRVGIGHHVVGRSIATMEGHGANSFATYLLTLPFYFLAVFASFFPWSIKLPWLTRKLWRQRDAIDNYLIAGVAILFVVFTFVKTKLPHYTLPAFPLLALLLARALSVESANRFVKRGATSIAAIYVAVAFIVPSIVAPLFPARELFRQSRDYLRPEMQFGAVEYNEPSLVWYFRGRVRGWLQTPALHPTNVQPFMEQPGARFVILPTQLATNIYPALPVDWKKFSTRGFNIVKGKRVDLTLILKPE